jgi:DNA repair protein RecO (recombination protein O)
MANYLTDRAICLRVTDFSETSQIVGLFTREHGLVPMIAKGSKRQNKKTSSSGPLDLLTSGEVVFIPARGAGPELATLASWELLHHHAALRRDLPALNAAMLCAEVTVLLVHPHDPHSDLFDQLEATLELLATAQRTRALVAYVKSAIDAAGYAPQLETCLVCGKSLDSDMPLRFHPRAGGLTCASPSGGRNCHLPGGAALSMAISGRIVAALRRLPTPLSLLAQAPRRPADAAALALAMEMQLLQVQSLTDKPIRTRYLLSTVFGAQAPQPHP